MTGGFLGARESPLVRTVLGRRRWCRVVVVGRGRVRWGWVVAGPGVAGSLPVVGGRAAGGGGRRWGGRWWGCVGGEGGWVGGELLSAGGGPLQAAVGQPAHAPAGGLVAEAVVVAAQAAQAVGAGGAGRAGGVVVEVAALRAGAAAGKAAAPVAGADEPVECRGGAVAGGGGRWAEAGAGGGAAAEFTGVAQGEQLTADLLHHGDRRRVRERGAGDGADT